MNLKGRGENNEVHGHFYWKSGSLQGRGIKMNRSGIAGGRLV
jgi:hypothetical protein